MKDIEKTFEYAKNFLSLSDVEKASGRAQLLAVMQDRPMRTPEPVRSPFTGLLSSTFLRYGVVALLFLSVGSGGVAYAAVDAKPSSPLYAVKIKITEPVQLALTFDPKKHADLEVELVDRRLKELAEASVDGSLTPDQLALVSDSLTSNINNAQQDISALPETGDAFESASDLASTLSVHSEILEKVQDANPEASTSIAAVAATVANELSETNDIVDSAQSDVQDTATTTLDIPSDEQATDSTDSLAEIKAEIAVQLNSFDASDRTDINASLADIQTTIANAQQKDSEGDSKAAYLLYIEANQQLLQLKTALEADQTLGIDVIDASTTSPEPEQ